MSSSGQRVALLFAGGSEEFRRTVPSLLNTVDINVSSSGLRGALSFIGGSEEVERAVPSLPLLVFCL